MAFLVQPSRSRRRLKYALFIGVALSVSGCLVFEQIGWRFSGPTFSHNLHVGVEELECIDCHTTADTNEDSGFPRLKACMLCHEDFDAEAEPAARAAAFFKDGKYMITRVNQLDFEVTFSHLDHVTDEESCVDCHEAIINSDEVQPWMSMSMAQCVTCHEETSNPTGCASCHQEISINVAPNSHNASWDQFHGLGVRNGSYLTVDRCDMCHEQSTCVTCHQEEEPANHNNFWRRRAHGLTARMDRENCDACHTPDYCDSCHTTATPQSHNGLYGGTRNTHCYGCHLTGNEQSCNLCHVGGAPSHALAPPQPPGHNPASDCRECHMLLSHVDKGDDCNACHN